jgi:protein-disulfide isomerase
VSELAQVWLPRRLNSGTVPRMSKLLPWLCVLTLLSACSKPADSTPPKAGEKPAAAASTAAPAAAPAPVDGAVPVPQDLLAHLSRPDSPVLGPANAPVTLVEFLDPACSACRAYAPVVKQIEFLYPKEVRVVVRFAAFHQGSEDAIRILLAAQRQGKFETVLAALFDAQDTWAPNHTAEAREAWKVAATTGLNLARARQDAASAQSSQRLTQEDEDIVALRVVQTPTFYVNGKLMVDTDAQTLLRHVGAEVKAATAAH